MDQEKIEQAALGKWLAAAALGATVVYLLARSPRTRPLAALLPGSQRKQAIHAEKSIRINAPPEQVYALFANYDNFPRFLSNIIDVRDLGQNRSHWIVRGPAGTEWSWNAVLTDQRPGQRLAWEGEADAELSHAGEILFDPVRGGTRVTVRIAWRPPAGAAGHAIASLLGSDPGQQLERDLPRMKALAERGDVAFAGRAQAGPGQRPLH